jgi:hypothetical protein
MKRPTEWSEDGLTALSSKIDPTKILVESLFNSLRTVEFRPRLFNDRIAREPL